MNKLCYCNVCCDVTVPMSPLVTEYRKKFPSSALSVPVDTMIGRIICGNGIINKPIAEILADAKRISGYLDESERGNNRLLGELVSWVSSHNHAGEIIKIFIDVGITSPDIEGVPDHVVRFMGMYQYNLSHIAKYFEAIYPDMPERIRIIELFLTNSRNGISGFYLSDNAKGYLQGYHQGLTTRPTTQSVGIAKELNDLIDLEIVESLGETEGYQIDLPNDSIEKLLQRVKIMIPVYVKTKLENDDLVDDLKDTKDDLGNIQNKVARFRRMLEIID